MKPAYRVIHFTPNPLTEVRIPLGAAVFDGASVLVATVEHSPHAECIGRTRDVALFHHLIDDLASVRSLDSLPPSLGPLVDFGELHELPQDLPLDPVKWVQRFILNQPRDPKDAGAQRTPRRSRYSERFFETWKIAHYMRPKYKPSESWDGWLSESGPLKPIQHWVADDTRILLVEALVPTLDRHEQHLLEVAEKFSSYRWVMQETETPRQGTLCALVLGGGSPEFRKKITRDLQNSAHEVIDGSDPGQRAHFVKQVKELGRSSSILH